MTECVFPILNKLDVDISSTHQNEGTVIEGSAPWAYDFFEYHRYYHAGDVVTFNHSQYKRILLTGVGVFKVRVAEVGVNELDGTHWPTLERGHEFILSGGEPAKLTVPAGLHLAIVPLSDPCSLVMLTKLEETPGGRPWLPKSLLSVTAEDLSWDYDWVVENRGHFAATW